MADKYEAMLAAYKNGKKISDLDSVSEDVDRTTLVIEVEEDGVSKKTVLDDGGVAAEATTRETADKTLQTNIDTAKSDLEAEIEKKQDTLTPGTGISITDNVIECTLDTTVYKIVEELPTEDIDENKIYVIKDPDSTDENNLYIEYMYINGKWEIFGKFKADVDLSEYAKTADVNAVAAKLQEAIDDITDYTEDEMTQLVSDVLGKD